MSEKVATLQCGFTKEEIATVVDWLLDYENGDLPEAHDCYDDIDWFDYM